MIPHPSKRHKGGEDAYVARADLLVVADGVGGWAEQGVDPGLFSKALVKDIEEEYVKNPDETLKNMLVEAVKRNPHKGSSTAVLAKLDRKEKGLMRTCNLGDSGYAIFREDESTEKKWKMQFKSQEQ